MTMKHNKVLEESENVLFIELEEQWIKSSIKFTDNELLEIFGDVIKTMNDKVAELKEQQDTLIKKIYELGKQYVHGNDIDSFFARLCIEHFLINKLQKVENSLFLLQRLKSLKKHHKVKKQKGITTKDIENARNVALVTFAEQNIGNLRKSGKNYLTKCPIHDDRSPSFFIYPESNRFHCFGCGASGDTIALAQKILGLDFKSTIYFLIHKLQ